MPIASIRPTIIGLLVRNSRIQFFLRGTYSAGLVERQGRLSIQYLHRLRRCYSATSLLLKTGPSIRLTCTIELSRPGRKTIPCEYESKPVQRSAPWTVDQEVLVSLIPRLISI